MTKIYLAGPISGLTYEEAGQWRWDVINSLVSTEFEFFNPLLSEDKNHVQDSGTFGNGHDLQDQICSMFFTRDIYWVDQSDIILASFEKVPKALGGGTPFEFGYAMAKDKVIISVGPKENIPMFCLKGSSIQFDKMEDAIRFLKTFNTTRGIFLPSIYSTPVDLMPGTTYLNG